MGKIIFLDQSVPARSIASQLQGWVSVYHSATKRATRSAFVISEVSKISQIQSDASLSSRENLDVTPIAESLRGSLPGDQLVITDRTLLRKFADHYNMPYGSEPYLVVYVNEE